MGAQIIKHRWSDWDVTSLGVYFLFGSYLAVTSNPARKKNQQCDSVSSRIICVVIICGWEQTKKLQGVMMDRSGVAFLMQACQVLLCDNAHFQSLLYFIDVGNVKTCSIIFFATLVIDRHIIWKHSAKNRWMTFYCRTSYSPSYKARDFRDFRRIKSRN